LLKLKDTILYKDLPYNIQSHLTAPISRETKWGMACFIVLMLDILSILPVLVKHDRISSSPSICSFYGRIIQRDVILPVDHGAKNDGFCYRFSCTADQSVPIHFCRLYLPRHPVLPGCFP